MDKSPMPSVPFLAALASPIQESGPAGQDSFDARAKRLTRLYITALSLVALLCIAGQWLVQISLRRQLSDSTVVNIAGRQRMLSQKISKAALALLAAKNATEAESSLAEIDLILPLWNRCHQGLQQGDQELGLPGNNSAAVREMFEKIELAFNAMHFSASQLAAEARSQPNLSPEQLAQLRTRVMVILAHEGSFLAGMDQLVFQYDREANQRVSHLQWIERILLGCTLLVLLLEGLLIFRPAVRQIQLAVVQLRRTSAELQNAKDVAEAANQEKSLFLASMSHELRSPLHAILGSAELTTRGPLNDRQREYLEIIDDSSRSLLALVNDLLDLAKIEAGKLELHLEPIDLVQLAHRATAMLTVEAERKDLSLTSQIDPQLTGAWLLDGLRLKQVLINLLNNAVKFTDAGSVGLRLALEERTGDSWLRCEVSDTGIGIPPPLHEKIFQAFTQVDSTSSRRFGGAGLGLAICTRLVNLMEGQIGLSSEPGLGSKFWLAIPLRRAEVLPVPAELPKPEGSYPRLASHVIRVLVAEDAPVNRRVIADMLTELGCITTLAASGGEALEAFAQNAFEVVILDVHMPDRDGYEVAREFRQLETKQNRLRTPIVALTAAAMAQDRQLWQAAGMDAYWTKPVSLEVLRQGLARILEKGDASGQSLDELIPPSPTALEQLRKRPALLQDLIELFEIEAPRLLEQIQTGLSQADAPAIFQAAHRLKGQAATFAGEAVCQVLQRMEDAAEAESLTVIHEEWPHLSQAMSELLRQLRLEMPVAT